MDSMISLVVFLAKNNMNNIQRLQIDIISLEEQLINIKSRVKVIEDNSSNCMNAISENFDISGVIPLDLLIQSYIKYALIKCDGNQTKCAKILDISRSTLWRHLGCEQYP